MARSRLPRQNRRIVRVRNYRSKDLASAVDLFTVAVHGLAPPHYDVAQCEAWAPRRPDLEYWRARLGAMRVLLAERTGVLAGMLGYHDDGHVDLLFTHPEHARRGVATRLHDEAVQRLCAGGVHALYTRASEVARPFFERHGYAVERREVVRVRGVDLHRYAMRRSPSA